MHIELTREQLFARGGVLDELLEKCFDAAIIVDKDGYILYNSSGSIKLRGIPKEKLYRMRFSEINPSSKFHATLKTGKAQLGIIDMVNGRKCIVNVYPIRCEGELIGAVTTMLFRSVDGLKHLLAKLLEEDDKAAGQHQTDYNSLARVGTSYTFQDYIGQSRATCELIQQCRLAAHSPRPILLIGETGTGKEILANSIHSEANALSWKPFVKINCSAIPRELLESELFGHEKGAFTGASAMKTGKFELAAGGSILLDEIGEMDLRLQSKLLRVLEEKEFERVGGTKILPMNARIIASTNANLRTLCRSGKFREDLYYRLSTFEIKIPPLRKRMEDIPLIIENLMHRDQLEFELSPEAMKLMQSYRWPGNVRELRNILNRLDVRHHGRYLSYSDVFQELDLEENGTTQEPEPPFSARCGEKALAEIRFREVLVANHYNMTETARQLGVCRATVYNRAKRYGIKIGKTSN